VLRAYVAPLAAGGALEQGNEVRTLSGQRVHLTNTADAKVCGENIILPIKTLLHLPARSPDDALLNPSQGEGNRKRRSSPSAAKNAR
jgi:hypothetical protein